MLYPPAVVATALFTALITMDYLHREYNQAYFHFFSGVFVVLSISILCQILGDTAGWIFLSIPVIVVFITLIFQYIQYIVSYVEQKSSSPSPTPSPSMECDECGYVKSKCCCKPKPKPKPKCQSSCSDKKWSGCDIQGVSNFLPPSVTGLPVNPNPSKIDCPR